MTNISRHGMWLLSHHREVFLPYEKFPWFVYQPLQAVLRAEEVAPDHFHWPDIDVDLTMEIIEHPDRFPLQARHPA